MAQTKIGNVESIEEAYELFNCNSFNSPYLIKVKFTGNTMPMSNDFGVFLVSEEVARTISNNLVIQCDCNYNLNEIMDTISDKSNLTLEDFKKLEYQTNLINEVYYEVDADGQHSLYMFNNVESYYNHEDMRSDYWLPNRQKMILLDDNHEPYYIQRVYSNDDQYAIKSYELEIVEMSPSVQILKYKDYFSAFTSIGMTILVCLALFKKAV